jgi:hypothetical protein
MGVNLGLSPEKEEDILACDGKVLRRPNWQNMTGGRRKLQTEEPCNLYSSSDIIRLIKSGRRMWAGHVARKK